MHALCSSFSVLNNAAKERNFLKKQKYFFHGIVLMVNLFMVGSVSHVGSPVGS